MRSADLIPYAFNNRKHPEQQIDRIANSIKEFGFNQPIVIDESNVVLVGHGRLAAALKLGLQEVPVVKIESLSEAKKKAYRILDNKLQNDSEWDFANIEMELNRLEELDFDLAEWGLDELLAMAPTEEPEVSEDSGPGAIPDEPFIKRGDILELGPHRVMCGDCCNETEMQELCGTVTPQLFITDPPYGVDYAQKNIFLNAISPANRIQEDIENDSKTPEEMGEFWLSAFRAAHQFTDREASYYIFGPQGGDLMMMMMMSIKDANWQLKHMLVWVKNNHVLGRCDYHYKHEPIWFGWKDDSTHHFYGDSSQFSVWEFNKPQKSDLHPTMKPVELIAQAIRNSSKAGDVVLDSFLGSGTTLIAADQLGRICYGMEISPKYCQVILERYQRYCAERGKDCLVKINGEPFNSREYKDGEDRAEA